MNLYCTSNRTKKVKFSAKTQLFTLTWILKEYMRDFSYESLLMTKLLKTLETFLHAYDCGLTLKHLEGGLNSRRLMFISHCSASP